MRLRRANTVEVERVDVLLGVQTVGSQRCESRFPSRIRRGLRKITLATCFWSRVLAVFLNDMRYINSHFTYLLTYLLTYLEYTSA